MYMLKINSLDSFLPPPPPSVFFPSPSLCVIPSPCPSSSLYTPSIHSLVSLPAMLHIHKCNVHQEGGEHATDNAQLVETDHHTSPSLQTYNTIQCILHSHTYNTAIQWQTSHADNTVYSTQKHNMYACVCYTLYTVQHIITSDGFFSSICYSSYTYVQYMFMYVCVQKPISKI